MRQQSNSFSASHAFSLYIGLLLISVLAILQLTFSLSMAVVELDTTQPGQFKLYWSDDAKSQYNEFQSKTLSLQTGHNTLFFILLSHSDVQHLKIKPHNDPTAEVILNNVVVRALGFDQVINNSIEHFQLFRKLTDFKRLIYGKMHWS